MKKSLIFAFVAVVAMLVASCKPSVEAPKARFSYDVDGMKVTFNNLTKEVGTLTFAWEFGDGATSTEKSPVHEYTEAGSYTVTLLAKNEGGENKASETIVLEKKAVEIVLDGKFEDWAQVPADLLAVAKMSEASKWENLYELRLYADADYLYFYAEFSAEEYEGLDDAGNPITAYMVDPLDFYLNVDGDESTGSNSYLWVNSAADVLIEGFWADNFESAGVYIFPADADQGAWAWADAEVAGSTSSSDRVILGNGHAAIEGKIMLAMLPVQVKGMKVGLFTSNTDWAESGCLPETILNDDGTTTPSPLLEVKLPQ